MSGLLTVYLSPSSWKAGLWSHVMVWAQWASSVAHVWNVSSWNGGSKGFSRKQIGYSPHPSIYFPSCVIWHSWAFWAGPHWCGYTEQYIYRNRCTQTHMYKGTDGCIKPEGKVHWEWEKADLGLSCSLGMWSGQWGTTGMASIPRRNWPTYRDHLSQIRTCMLTDMYQSVSQKAWALGMDEILIWKTVCPICMGNVRRTQCESFWFPFYCETPQNFW